MDSINITGEIKFTVTEVATGKVIEVFEDKNLVVNGGKIAAAALIGGNPTNNHINRIAFGTNGANPNLLDSDLSDRFIKNVLSANPDGQGGVVFSFNLSENEANGLAIQEMGLFTASGVLFSRKNRTAINKTSDIRFDGTWTIKF